MPTIDEILEYLRLHFADGVWECRYINKLDPNVFISFEQFDKSNIAITNLVLYDDCTFGWFDLCLSDSDTIKVLFKTDDMHELTDNQKLEFMLMYFS